MHEAASACVQCGQAQAAVSPPQAWGGVQQQQYPTTFAPTQVTHVHQGKAPPTQGIAVVALLLNIFLWPGLGSIIAGRSEGWGQGFLFLFGIPLTLLLIGIPMLIGAWIWGIVTGVDLINEAGRAQVYR